MASYYDGTHIYSQVPKYVKIYCLIKGYKERTRLIRKINNNKLN